MATAGYRTSPKGLLDPIEGGESPQAASTSLCYWVREELPVREAILDGEVVALDARWWRSMRDQRHVVAERRELADGRKEYRAPLLAEDADVAIR